MLVRRTFQSCATAALICSKSTVSRASIQCTDGFDSLIDTGHWDGNIVLVEMTSSVFSNARLTMSNHPFWHVFSNVSSKSAILRS